MGNSKNCPQNGWQLHSEYLLLQKYGELSIYCISKTCFSWRRSHEVKHQKIAKQW